MEPTGPAPVTELLLRWRAGDQECLNRLLPQVEGELRRIAHRYMRMERQGHTLQTTALVNEAYLKLVDQAQVDWQNRAQFLGVAAQLMRRILVDYARARETAKRAGPADGVDAVNLEGGMDGTQAEEILAVDEALERLTALDAQQAKVVELRYFAGLTIEETAEASGISVRTVKREWTMAAAWLRTELSPRAEA